MHCRKKTRWWRESDALGNVLLGTPGSGHSCGGFFDVMPIATSFQTMYTCLWQWFSPVTLTSQQDNALYHTAQNVQVWSAEHSEEFKVLPWPSNSSHLNPIEHLWNVLEPQVQSVVAPLHNPRHSKSLLLTPWWQIPQDTYRCFANFMPWWVTAVLAVNRGSTAYYAGDHNVLALRCIYIYMSYT